MSTPHDPHRDDALTDDERALAARLSRLGGPREPSAALDAAILAAARAAVAGDTVPTPVAGTLAAVDAVTGETESLAAARPAAPASAPSTAAPSTAAQSTAAPSAATPSTAAPRDLATRHSARRRRPRWPLGLGLAASLVLAAGIGFKLFENGAPHDVAASAESAGAQGFKAEADAYEAPLAEAVMIEPPLQRTPPPPPPPLEEAAAAAPQRAARSTSPPSADARSVAADSAAELDGFAAEAEAPVEAAALPAKPVAASLPAPAPQASAEQKIQAKEALDRVEVSGSRLRRDAVRDVGAAEHTRTPLNERREQASSAARAAEAERRASSAAVPAPPPPPPPPPVPRQIAPAAPAPSASPPAGQTGAGVSFTPDPALRDKSANNTGNASGLYDDRPPVSADSPEFRQAWLQRIRKLLADGRRAEAKDSLLEFRRRCPDPPVPEDLRPLLAPAPSPAPPAP